MPSLGSDIMCFIAGPESMCKQMNAKSHAAAKWMREKGIWGFQCAASILALAAYWWLRSLSPEQSTAGPTSMLALAFGIFMCNIVGWSVSMRGQTHAHKERAEDAA